MAISKDIGCGHGVLSSILAKKSRQRRVLGIDPSPHKIKIAKNNDLPNLKFEKSYINEVVGSFGTIFVVDVFIYHHLKKK
jgi:2-polyprenyl-3-methyl-5-hydroxy-6-metoxy-1,4-benzoquinol methylase